MPLREHGVEALAEPLDLRGGFRGLAGNERGVTRRLTQPQQRFERGEDASALPELGHDIRERGRPHRVVDLALPLGEHAVQRRLGARR